MAGILGPLIQAAVRGVGGGLAGQNQGDQLAFENRERMNRQRLLDQESQQRAGLVQAQIDELNRRQHEYVPTTEQEAIDYELGIHPERLQRPDRPEQERNIDPLSPEGIKARLAYERQRPRPTSFDRDYSDDGDAPAGAAGGKSLADEFKLIGALGSMQDDVQHRIDRRSSQMPKPFHELGIVQKETTDSAAWDQHRAADSTAIDQLQHRYDELGDIRSGLVGRLLGGGAKGEGGKSEGNATPHDGTNGLEAYQRRVDELTQQLQEALAQMPEGHPNRAKATARYQQLVNQAAREAGLIQ